ncbi:MAG: DUF2247 family protein [Candidatus Accumulibacter sp.]|nr:DUF2247 family protein [Accumulibacter sp.]
MSAFDVMKEINLLDWNTLLVGLERGWCEKKSLIDFSEIVFARVSGEIDGDLLTMVLGESVSDDELISTGLRYLETCGQAMSQDKKNEAIEKWRFAHLSSLLQSENSDEEKIAVLQELYAEFGFPEDMASCSIYSRDQIDPLLAAARVAEDLSRRFLSASPDVK